MNQLFYGDNLHVLREHIADNCLFHSVLKLTGSIHFHFDHTASHYLEIVLGGGVGENSLHSGKK